MMHKSARILMFVLFAGNQIALSSAESAASESMFDSSNSDLPNFDDLVGQLNGGYRQDEDKDQTPGPEPVDALAELPRKIAEMTPKLRMVISEQKKTTLSAWMKLAASMRQFEDEVPLPRATLRETLAEMRALENGFVAAHSRCPLRTTNLVAGSESARETISEWNFQNGKWCYLKALELALASARSRDFCLALIDEMSMIEESAFSSSTPLTNSESYSWEEIAGIVKLLEEKEQGFQPMNVGIRRAVEQKLLEPAGRGIRARQSNP